MVLVSTLAKLRKKKKPILNVTEQTPTAPKPTPEQPKPEENKGTGKKQIIFDGKQIGSKVKVITEGGKEFNFTREEYKKYNEQIGGGSRELAGGGFTPNVRSAVDIQRENQRARMLQQGQNVTPTNQLQIQGQQQGQISPNIPSSLYNFKDTGIVQGFESFGLIDNAKSMQLQQAINLEGGQLKSGANIAKATLGLFIDLADNLAKVASLGALGKDTLDVKNAKENISLAKAVIDRQIALVPTGEVNILELSDAVKMYSANLNQLESTNKRIGLDNFAYWISDGRNLEQEIFTKKSEFAELERMLQQARTINMQNNLLNAQMQLQ